MEVNIIIWHIFQEEDRAIVMPRKLNVNEMYTSNTFSDYTSTSREVLEEDNLPLSKTSLHGATRDTFLVSIVC